MKKSLFFLIVFCLLISTNPRITQAIEQGDLTKTISDSMNVVTNQNVATTTISVDNIISAPTSTPILTPTSTPDVLSGEASWYDYKDGYFTASTDFKIGTKLKVTNLKNNKFVVVTVNDYGPSKDKHPNRILDLDRIAFEEIADLSAGVVNIKAEKISEAEANKFIAAKKIEKDKNEEKEAKASTNKKVELTSLAGVVLDEKSGKVLWQKNYTKQMPMASLTKIIAVKTFFDVKKQDLNKIVTYKKQDEEYNYKYCSKDESAKINLKDGDKVKVRDLVYAALVGSANNAVESLVRVSGTSRANFIKKMNSNAKKWGAKSTKFIEPTGLSPKNVTSAKDYALITKAAFKDKNVEKVSSTSQYSFSTVNTKRKITVKNTSSIAKEKKVNVVGSKTGFLYEAGYCLMTRVKTPANKNIIVVVMNNKTRYGSVQDTKSLLQTYAKIKA